MASPDLPPTQRTVGEACRRSFARPRTVPRRRRRKKKKSMAGGSGGLRGQPATHCRVRLIQTRRLVDQFPVPRVPSCLSNSWPGISHWSPSWLSHPAPPRTPRFAPKLSGYLLSFLFTLWLLRTSAPLCHFSSGLLIEMLRKEAAPLRPAFVSLAPPFELLPRPGLQT